MVMTWKEIVAGILDIKPEIQYVEKTITIMREPTWEEAVKIALKDGILPILNHIPWEDSSKWFNQEDIKWIVSTDAGFNVSLHLLDNNYLAVDEDQTLAFFEKMKIHKAEWVKDSTEPLKPGELGDCDEFMALAWGLANGRKGKVAFGIASNGAHAFNVVITPNRELLYYEPQTNTLVPVTPALGIKHIWM